MSIKGYFVMSQHLSFVGPGLGCTCTWMDELMIDDRMIGSFVRHRRFMGHDVCVPSTACSHSRGGGSHHWGFFVAQGFYMYMYAISRYC